MTQEARVLHFYNIFHVGDNLLNLKYFLYLTKLLKENNCTIYYYYQTTWPYNKETTLRSYIDPSVVILKPLNERPPDSIELWQGHTINNVTHINSERYFELFYKKILNILCITDSTIPTTLWLDEPFLIPVYESLDQQYKDIDILILNTVGRSGQCNDTGPVNNLARYLHTRFNILTMDPLGEGIKSAGHLSLQEVGAISTHAKYIISTCSGPHIPCFNKQTKEYVKKWFIIGPFIYYSIDCTNTTDMNVIKDYFDSVHVGN
jgi:hypothetical protein